MFVNFYIWNYEYYFYTTKRHSSDGYNRCAEKQRHNENNKNKGKKDIQKKKIDYTK